MLIRCSAIHKIIGLPRSKKEFAGLEIFGVERLDEAVRLCRDLAD